MMKSADLRNRNDAPARWRLHFAPIGAVVVERLMRAGGVVVREIRTQQTSEVPFVEHDDVIEAFPLSRWLCGVTRHGLWYGPWNEAATDSVPVDVPRVVMHRRVFLRAH